MNQEHQSDDPVQVISEHRIDSQNVLQSDDKDEKMIVLNTIDKINTENAELKNQISENENRIFSLQKSCSGYKEKAERCAVQIESMKRELQTIVMNYAKSEKDLLNLRKHFTDVDKKYKELLKEKDVLQTKLKELNNEKKQLMANVERNVLECANLKRDNELCKTKLAQADVRIEQLQLTVAEINLKYQSAQGVLNQIESGLGSLKSDDNNLDNNAKLSLFDDVSDQEEDKDEHQTVNWVEKYLSCINNNQKLSTRINSLEEEKAQLISQLNALDKKLEDANQQLLEYERKVTLIEAMKEELIAKQNTIADIKQKFDRINEINRDLVNDIDSSKHKEGELLEYTERLTSKMVSLQTECNTQCEKLKLKELQSEGYKADLERLSKEHTRIKHELDILIDKRETEVKEFQAKLLEKQTESDLFKNKVEELENNIKIIKRKQIVSFKELNKEIQILRKHNHDLEHKLKANGQQQSNDRETINSSSLSSRTNSLNSLNELSQNIVSDNEQNVSTATISSSSSSNELVTSLNDIDKNMLIERILRLQRTLNKKNEKIDFLEEHNQQLMEEVKKKGKLLQYYILKEETGALATETMDKNKAYISRHGGIMSSLYNSSMTDDTMTLDRSLEINNKLHAVLEDTLLKNMTLKENLNTLACEIDRLNKLRKE